MLDDPHYYDGEPGIDVEAGRWLADAGVAVIGSDNFAVEHIPFPKDTVFPVHQLVIAATVSRCSKDSCLKELAQTGRSESCSSRRHCLSWAGTGTSAGASRRSCRTYACRHSTPGLAGVRVLDLSVGTCTRSARHAVSRRFSAADVVKIELRRAATRCANLGPRDSAGRPMFLRIGQRRQDHRRYGPSRMPQCRATNS
jgi:hypothetical protein